MTRTAQRIALAATVALLVQTPAVLGLARAPVRVLILSGQNNHNWRETTPALEAILRNCGRFTVAVTERPETLTAAEFAKVDVLVSNWNTFGAKAAVKEWPDRARSDFIEFVRNGGGVVVVHAGGSMFGDWTEFQQIIGATWGKGTGHGPMHEFEVTFAGAEHPITKGLTPFRTTDELWHRMVVTGEPVVLATAFSAKDKRGSGAHEPIVRITQFGKGRCFNLGLGHNVAAMQPPGFRALLVRGTEWAATGKVTIRASTLPGRADVDRMLAAIAGYTFGDSRAALVAVEELVYASSAHPELRGMLEAGLVALLAGDATVDCKKFVCKELSITGTAQAVPALTKQLSDAHLAIHARAALERIPGAAATEALCAALPGASGQRRVGLINTLARRRSVEAVPALSALAQDADLATAGAAVDALGRIAGTDALQALAAVKQPPAALRMRRSAALLLCAEALVRDGQANAAAPVLAELIKPDQATHIRLAAFPHYVATLGAKGTDTLLNALIGDDSGLQRAAVRAFRTAPSTALTQAVAARLPALSTPLQEQLIVLLGERGDTTILPTILTAASSTQPGVQGAAIVALGQLGNAKTVATLATLVEQAPRDARAAVAAALARLPGDGVEEAIVAAAQAAPEAVQCELIKALAARNARTAAPALVALAGSDRRTVRAEAVKALGELGDAAIGEQLVDMLGNAGATDRPKIESALVAICRRGGTPGLLLDAAAASTGAQRASLLAALGAFGGEEALTALRQALEADDADVQIAAVRALAGWADAKPLDALLAAATATDDLRIRVLALRGVADLAKKADDRPESEIADVLDRAFAVASRTDEKRALLAALRTVRSGKALGVAFAQLADKDLAAEASLAVVDIAAAVGPRSPELANAALERVIARCPDPVVAAEAAGLVGMASLSSDNLAIGGKATSPDGLEKDGAAHGDQAAIDGNPDTYWDEKNGQKLYRLRVEMIEEARVNAIRILGYHHHSYAPKDFEVICDGEVVKAVKNAQYKDNVLLVRLPATVCRSVELAITGYYTHSPAVRELEIYGETDKPVNPKPKPAGIADGVYQTEKSLACARDGRTLWRLNVDPKEGKPYMHPLRLPNGDVITDLRPADHVWHRALWFSWKHINGLNYWEENKTTGLSQGRTSLKTVDTNVADDGAATVRMQLEYHPPDEPALLAEERRIAISAPDADGCYRIDWTATFTAGEKELKLDRTPVRGERGGRGHGGYAGFSARLAPSLRSAVFANSDGATTQEQTHGKPARWMDLSGENGGIAIFDHPQNPRHPAPWYVAQKMPYFSPAFLFREPMTLAPGQTITLRYRVAVHGKAAGPEWLENEWKAFAAE